ncbi:pyroglutamylated RF-amide peptide receptor-like isoform X2 [Montipora foliosa]|uniref:pyroglutamylated RF-amide peptide receptor-like isoform X2 n=1 Tax=Montipora foliosa TaxID=591990 RepID=UPI0035F1B70E
MEIKEASQMGPTDDRLKVPFLSYWKTNAIMVTSLDVTLLTIKSLIFLASITGNLLVIFVVTRNRDMRTPFNYLLVNLAVADIVYPSFVLLHFIVSLMIISADEMPGNAICMFLSKTAWTGAIAGVITMVVIARERYNTIVHPHGDRGKLTTRNLKIIIPCTWIFAVIFMMRGLVLQGFGKELGVRSCEYFWKNQKLNMANSLIWLTFICISFLLIVGLYSTVVYTLWFKHRGDNEVANQQAVLKVRKRVTMMVLIVTAMFEICWITDTILHIIVKKLISDEILIAHTVMMLNSAVNPFVYALLSQRFRQKMKEMLHRCSILSGGRIGPYETSLSSTVLQQLPTSIADKSLPASEIKNVPEVLRSSEIC